MSFVTSRRCFTELAIGHRVHVGSSISQKKKKKESRASTRARRQSLPIRNPFARTYTHKDVGLWGWGIKTSQLSFNAAHCFSTMIWSTSDLDLGPIYEGPRELMVKKWASLRLDMLAAIQRNSHLFPGVSYSQTVFGVHSFYFLHLPYIP